MFKPTHKTALQNLKNAVVDLERFDELFYKGEIDPATMLRLQEQFQKQVVRVIKKLILVLEVREDGMESRRDSEVSQTKEHRGL